MAVIPSSSLKFECKHCDKIYLHHYAHAQYRYPHCPDCKQAGLLLGRVEKEDLLRYPLEFASSYVRQTLHKLGKQH